MEAVHRIRGVCCCERNVPLDPMRLRHVISALVCSNKGTVGGKLSGSMVDFRIKRNLVTRSFGLLV